MKAICKNCEYFVQISRDSSTQNWGDCTNPANLVSRNNGSEKYHVFTWEDKSCEHFKQKKTSDQLISKPTDPKNDYCPQD